MHLNVNKMSPYFIYPLCGLEMTLASINLIFELSKKPQYLSLPTNTYRLLGEKPIYTRFT